MPNITLDKLRAKYPPEDRDEHDRAYAAATLAGQLAELVYALRTRAGLTRTELARRMGTTPVLDRPHRRRRQPAHPRHAGPPRPRHRHSPASGRPRDHRRRPRRSRLTRSRCQAAGPA